MRDRINVPHMRQELLDGQICECGDPRCTPSALLSDMGIDHPLDATAEQLTAWALEASKALEIHKSQIRQLTTTNTVLRRLMRATCPSDDLRQSSTDRAM